MRVPIKQIGVFPWLQEKVCDWFSLTFIDWNPIAHKCNRYSLDLWKWIWGIFNWLPLAAVINESIFWAHSGLSSELIYLDEINKIQRPVTITLYGIVNDLIWSSQNTDVPGWARSNVRGASNTYGSDIISEFHKMNSLNVTWVSSSVQTEGFSKYFDDQLICLFSSPNLREEYKNYGAFIEVNDEGISRIQVFVSDFQAYNPEE